MRINCPMPFFHLRNKYFRRDILLPIYKIIEHFDGFNISGHDRPCQRFKSSSISSSLLRN